MDSQEIRKKFLDFFEERDHKIIPSHSLIPGDETVLFTTAGMQQFNDVLSGKNDPIEQFDSRLLVSCQKCFRTNDIEEVGDISHHTFFEMLGNWSIGGEKEGGYFKEKAIEYALEFFVEELKLDKNKLWVTVFQGNQEIPRDEEAISIWKSKGIPQEHIKEFGMADNFWGPVLEEGPCGPCSEIHYDRGESFGCGRKDCGPNCLHCQRFVELWNLVFMEYNRVKDSDSCNERSAASYKYLKLPQKNVDTGIGFERLVTIIEGKESSYETDLFQPLISKIESISPRSYEENKKAFRIIADHIRGSLFLIVDGVLPDNLGRGYILRRLLRRSIRYAQILDLKRHWYLELIQEIIKIYDQVYPEIRRREADIITVIENEEDKFSKTLNKGLAQLKKIISQKEKDKREQLIEGKEAFDLYQSYGFPLELTEELAREKGFSVEKEAFEKEFQKHQTISRKGADRKFGGHGLTGEEPDNNMTKKLHTATHLLQAALRVVLGSEVEQKGSDINSERLRFDFSFSRKMTLQEIKKTEDLVNAKIEANLKVVKEKMSLSKALDSGALSFFREDYPEEVYVYRIFDPETGEIFSKEICKGPHLKEIGSLGEFKIIKEESSSAGVRRIKAILN
jgi:alanyl-tRNA synthetase